MNWISLPNDPVTDFRGRVVQTQKLDDNLETIYKPIRCPGDACDERFTNIQAFQDHLYEHDEDLSGASSQAREERMDLDVAHLIFQVLSVLRNAPPENPINKVRRANDSMHAEKTWSRAWEARTSGEAVQLHAKQYEWLHHLLERRVPLSQEDKADNVEAQTLAQFLFGLSWHRYVQALTIVSARAAEEPNQPSAMAPEVADAPAEA